MTSTAVHISTANVIITRTATGAVHEITPGFEHHPAAGLAWAEQRWPAEQGYQHQALDIPRKVLVRGRQAVIGHLAA